jgi:hypothetical protein
MLISRILLAALLALLAWFVRNDRAEYERFKGLIRTDQRQRAFRRWTIRSFLFFCGASLAVLAVLGRLGAFVWMPVEFAGLSSRLASPDMSRGFLAGLAGAVVLGGLVGAAIPWLRRGRGARPPKPLGDIEPLFPRNRAERRWTALLAANAGPGEELFFRLVAAARDRFGRRQRAIRFRGRRPRLRAGPFLPGLDRRRRDHPRGLRHGRHLCGERCHLDTGPASFADEPEFAVASAAARRAAGANPITRLAAIGQRFVEARSATA